MNTSDLADHVASVHGFSKTQAKALIDGIFAAITNAAAKDEEVSIPGFGKFKVQDRPARDGRNPSTGETIKIAASRKLTFSAAKAIKEKLNG